MSSDHPRADRLARAEEMDRAGFESTRRIYRENFKNPADFTFIFTGSFSMDSLKGYLKEYLASLETESGDRSNYRDLGIRPPEEKTIEILHKGIDEKSHVLLFFDRAVEYDPVDSANVIALGEILKIRLYEILREKMNGIYGLKVKSEIIRTPYDHFQLRIGFPCSPQRYRELTRATLEEIRRIIDKGPELQTLEKVRLARIKNIREGYEDNNFWISNLRNMSFNGMDLSLIARLPEIIARLSPESVRETAARFIDPDKYIQIVLLPKDKTAH